MCFESRTKSERIHTHVQVIVCVNAFVNLLVCFMEKTLDYFNFVLFNFWVHILKILKKAFQRKRLSISGS